ncbi:hypothetical protein CALVIDRAFT_47126 [Calocera viscosa TUFC12733]|uniref:Uncharacterized protein n=1 Tax=Calocera viscosa (strain TUFC12733) TaxID=1330018 RepID=A0A167FKQ0_CALVF|nr:hypothetical protein CALVIDRAFT_47126 [Calocera viscosa TUFC12733]
MSLTGFLPSKPKPVSVPKPILPCLGIVQARPASGSTSDPPLNTVALRIDMQDLSKPGKYDLLGPFCRHDGRKSRNVARARVLCCGYADDMILITNLVWIVGRPCLREDAVGQSDWLGLAARTMSHRLTSVAICIPDALGRAQVEDEGG